MSTKLNVKIALLIVFSVLILLVPSFFRPYHSYIGEQSYFYERVSQLVSNGLPEGDELSYGGRDFSYDLGPIYLLSFLGKLINPELLLKFLPILLGVITLLLSYNLFKKLNIENKISQIALILFILSPTFFYTFTSYNIFALTLPLILIFCTLYIDKDKIKNYLSLVILFLMSFFDYKAVILALIFAVYYKIKEKKFKELYPALFISFISLIISYLPRIVKYGLISNNVEENYIRNLLTELGGIYGLSLFLIFFIFFGINYLWKEKYKNLNSYVMIILVIVFSILNKGFIVYSSLFLFYIASLGFNYLIDSKWESEKIRKLTIIFLVIGLLFSSYNFLMDLKDSQPTRSTLDALTKLEEQGTGFDIVFSHYKYGILINSISNKRNFMDTNFAYSSNFRNKYGDMQTIFYTRDADITKSLLNKYNIKYLLITKEMKEGLVWNNRDEGLLFVLENTQEFRKIIFNDEVEVWRIR